MEKYFSDNNVIALFKIESVKDIYTVNELHGLLFVSNQYGDCFDYFELDKNDVETEPTEDQVLERELEAFHNGETLYACHYIGSNVVVPEKYTIMTTDINVGQTVYYMNDNKITSGQVNKIQICERRLWDNAKPTNRVQTLAQFEVACGATRITLYRDKIFTTKEEVVEYLSNHIES